MEKVENLGETILKEYANFDYIETPELKKLGSMKINNIYKMPNWIISKTKNLAKISKAKFLKKQKRRDSNL